MPISDEDARRIAQAQTDEDAKNGCMGCLTFVLIPAFVLGAAVVATPLSLIVTLPLAYLAVRCMNRSL